MDFLDQARNMQTLKAKKWVFCWFSSTQILHVILLGNFSENSQKASNFLVETCSIFHFLFLQVKHENNDNTFRIIKMTKIVDILFLACVDDAALTWCLCSMLPLEVFFCFSVEQRRNIPWRKNWSLDLFPFDIDQNHENRFADLFFFLIF